MSEVRTRTDAQKGTAACRSYITACARRTYKHLKTVLHVFKNQTRVKNPQVFNSYEQLLRVAAQNQKKGIKLGHVTYPG